MRLCRTCRLKPAQDFPGAAGRCRPCWYIALPKVAWCTCGRGFPSERGLSGHLGDKRGKRAGHERDYTPREETA